MSYNIFMNSIQLQDALQIGLVIIAGLVWLLRLEGKQNFYDKRTSLMEIEIDRIKAKIEVIESDVVKQLSEIKQAVARIEGRLSAHDEK